MSSSSEITFPKNFVWGTATSSYQIEGAVHEDGRQDSIWDTYCRVPGAIRDNTHGDFACDHYHRYKEDVEMMAGMGIQAYRFSIAWPRILPTGTGQVNEAGLDFYDRLVDTLLAKGITPYATLYHWDLPQPLQDAGGWPDRGIVEPFEQYTDVVTRFLGDRVKNWMTINEPWCVAFLGYALGEHAPGHRDFPAALKTSHHVLLAHGRAVPVIRANVKDAKVGIVLNLTSAEPATDSPEDKAAALHVDGFQNRWFLDPVYKGEYPADMIELYGGESVVPVVGDDLKVISASTDFLGINYYNRAVLSESNEKPLGAKYERPEGEYTEMDWEVYPPGLYNVLTRVTRDYAPQEIFVTENGAAFKDELTPEGEICDDRRQAYIQEHLYQVNRAIQDGAPVHGYFEWSLMDNFEWAYGYTKRFGIIYVDYETQKRTLKQSAKWYTQAARQNGFTRAEV